MIKKKPKVLVKDRNYLGYINDLEDTDKRKAKHYKHYQKHGFDVTETWSLQNTIAKFVLPRLKLFRKTTCSMPIGMKMGEWEAILDKMIYFMEVIAKDTYYTLEKEDRNRYEEGKKLFGQWFDELWS